MIAAAVSGWRDGFDVVTECVESLVSRGIPVLYLDGAYETYCSDRALAVTPTWDLPRAGAAVQVVTVGNPWRNEAEKRTRAVALAREAYSADVVLVVDADERLEGGCRALVDWYAEKEESRAIAPGGMPQAEWWTLDLYWPEVPGSSQRLPRLLRAAGVEFRGHRDWEPWRNGRRVAYLQGEETGGADADRWAPVPAEVARLRHDRQVRPGWRREMSGRYARLHVSQGPCPESLWQSHRYRLDANEWECSACGRRVPVHGDAYIAVGD